ncbi:MAG TPA: helix-turn-helix domain-containing protein [Ktedonobacteraceae bacterium]
MRGPKAVPLRLSEEQRSVWEQLRHRHSLAQQIALRGRIVLGAADGKSKSEIAREVGPGVDRVRAWRMRWLSLQALPMEAFSVMERLSDIPRPGRPSAISAEPICQVVAMACEQPQERPISHWTGRDIADEGKRRGISKEISPRHAARIFKKGISSRSCFAPGGRHRTILSGRKRSKRCAGSLNKLPV